MQLEPGMVRPFEGKKAIVAAFGVWAEKNDSGWIHIHLTGDNEHFHHVTVCNNPNSQMRYNRALFRELRNLLIAYDKWPYGDEGADKEAEAVAGPPVPMT